jgi:L-seryl-tRNA(Ser) seleniumtransferase
LRPDRTALAALEGVLRLHLTGAALPLDRLWPDRAAHRARLERAAATLGAEIVAAEAFLGGGSAPEAPIPGEALALPGDDALLARLRRGDPPVVGYLRQGRLLLDLRTVDPGDDEALIAAVRRELCPPAGS